MSTTHRRAAGGLRILCASQAVLILAQATLAGHHLTGNGSMLAVHEAIATNVMTWLALLQVLAAVLLFRPGRGPAWPILATVALFGTLTLQLGWGFDGRLALHVPVGLGLLAGQLLLSMSVGRHQALAEATSPR